MLTCGVNDMFLVLTGHYNFTCKVLKNLPIFHQHESIYLCLKYSEVSLRPTRKR